MLHDLQTFCWAALAGAGIHSVMRAFGMLTDAAMSDPFGGKLDAMLTVGCLSVVIRPMLSRKPTAKDPNQ